MMLGAAGESGMWSNSMFNSTATQLLRLDNNCLKQLMFSNITLEVSQFFLSYDHKRNIFKE